MMRTVQRGFSLVELMVAVTLAMLTVLAVMYALSVYEARKRTTSGGNDAVMSAAVGAFMVEREVRMAGAGLTLPSGFACNAGTNMFFGGNTIADAGVLAPVQVTDGGDGPDRLRLLRSTAAFGVAPATVVQGMASASTGVTVDGSAGLAATDLFLVGGVDGNKICTVMQMTQDAQASGNGWTLAHDSNGSQYNPSNPDSAFTDAVRYDIGDVVINLGAIGLREYGVICNDGEAPAADNNCDLAAFDALAAPVDPTLDDVDPLVSQVVDFQVQYGVAPAASQTVDEWVDATGATWAAPSAANITRIKAVRIAIVTRGQREAMTVAPEEVVLWDEGEATERTRQFTDEERRYRYRVLTVIVPLINLIWAGA